MGERTSRIRCGLPSEVSPLEDLDHLELAWAELLKGLRIIQTELGEGHGLGEMLHASIELAETMRSVHLVDRSRVARLLRAFRRHFRHPQSPAPQAAATTTPPRTTDSDDPPPGREGAYRPRNTPR